MMPLEPVEEYMVREVIVTGSDNTRDSSSNVGRKKKSQIWNHFVKVNQNKGARCHYCDHVLSFAAGSLSNLLRHLRKKHPKIAAGFRYYNSNGNAVIIEANNAITQMEAEGVKNKESEAVENGLNEQPHGIDELMNVSMNVSRTSRTSSTDKPDIESIFRRDHSYGEKPAPKVYTEEYFGQFIQSELNKFKNELLKRQCKREMLQTLMKFQETEDQLYSSID